MAEPLLHVLGGGPWQVPTVRAAKALGLRVLVTDIYEERPAYALADHHEVVDIRDVPGTLEAAQRHRIDAILCDATDVGVPTAAAVAEALNLPGMGVEVARGFTDKRAMRGAAMRAGLPETPSVEVASVSELEREAREIGLPVVVKPATAQGSRGVSLVSRMEELRAALEQAERFWDGPILVERFEPGVEVTVEGAVAGGRYHTLAMSDKAPMPARPMVAERITYPAAIDPALGERIDGYCAALVETLGLEGGIIHAEFRVEGDRIAFLEIAARGGGSGIHSLVTPHLSGVDAVRFDIEVALGRMPRLELRPGARAANVGFLGFAPGRVVEVEGVAEARRIPGVADVFVPFAPGDVLPPIEHDAARHAQVIALGETREEVLAACERARRCIQVRTVAPA